MFTFVTLITFIALTKAYILRLFRVKSYLFEPINIIELLLGMSFPKSPKKLWERIIFLSFIIISGSYSIIFYSNIVDTKFDDEQIAFDTFKEIDEFNLQPYIVNGTFGQIFNIDDEGSLANIKAKTIQMQRDTDCFNVTKDTLDFVCIIYDHSVRSKQILVDGRSKLSTLQLGTQLMTYVLERSSPFVNKLKYIFRKVYESGIWQHTPGLKDYNIGHSLSVQNQSKTENIFLR